MFGARQPSGRTTVISLEGTKEEVRSANVRLKQMRQQLMEEKVEGVMRSVTSDGDWLVKEVQFQVATREFGKKHILKTVWSIRVFGILCMGHVFNFAILGIPSSTIRNHP